MKPKENHKKFLQLRKDYPIFEYQSYSFELKKQILELSFCFNISGKYKFKPKITIPKRGFVNWNKLKAADLNTFVFHIGMVELISYWKATCSPTIIIKPHKLHDEQVKWWQKLYFHGLGEFFYLNGIHTDISTFVEIISEGYILDPVDIILDNMQIIVPVGGGKDSVVTLELLKENNHPVRPMALNPRVAIERTIESAGFNVEDAIIVNRTLDPLLFELNEKGFLNGHTPFSALLAFNSVLCASLSGSSKIALSNENSANQSTIPGTKINHQYSKSFEFEEDFSNYIRKYIHRSIQYFSFLRPLNELQIAGLFSRFPSHFKSFRSCNVGSKQDLWCGECPKCLFTDIMLSSFLDPEERFQIFGKNLLDDPDLEPVFDELTGKSAIKPFECVGTPEEIKGALWKLSNEMPESDWPYLLKQFINSNKPVDNQPVFDQLLEDFVDDHLIPEQLLNILEQNIQSNQNRFKGFLERQFYGINKILILGYGREGRSTVNLLSKYFPDIKLGIADRNPEIESREKDIQHFTFYTGENYLDTIDNYDLVIKSPGVKLEHKYSNTRICSQTGFFLKYFRRQTIGVTGTKGKSTTASLIFHILKKAGKQAVLLGNIGTPAFDHIESITEDSIIVYELSAHQLQDSDASPHIAVLLNIFPEHLDHFNTIEAYSNAKWNIGKYQTKKDFLITTEKQMCLSQRVNSKIIKIDPKIIQVVSDTSVIKQSALKGDHNLRNISAAILSAELMGVTRVMSIRSIRTFKPLPHRLEYVGTFHDISFYNDSISTVPESTIAAIKTLPEVKTLLLGGFDRGIDYTELIEFLKISEIRTLILLGDAGKKMFEMLESDPALHQTYLFVESLKDAFDFIKSHTPKGTICLLSPAAASYDQFHNFEHRGDTFKILAKSL